MPKPKQFGTERLHWGKEQGVVGAAQQGEAPVAPDVAQDVGGGAPGGVVEVDVLDAAVGEPAADGLRHAPGVAVHGAVDDDGPAVGLVAAPAVVQPDDLPHVLAEQGAVGGKDVLDGQGGELFQGDLK